MASSMKLFGRALAGNDYPNYKELLDYGMERGYIVHESCNTNDVKAFLDSKPNGKDFSSTFYKKWENIKTMTRFEQFCDQIIYYYTGYNPHGLIESELPKILFENLKAIMPITSEEACSKCEDMLSSGIALAKDTILAIFDVFEKCKYDKFNINKVKNREARLIVFKKLDKLPNDPDEFLRYLVYLATEETALIKNTELLKKITSSNFEVSNKIKEFGISKLSTIYGRYKLIFLAFKHANKNNVTVINKLTKKSKCKENKSIDQNKNSDANYFQTLLSDKAPLNEVKLSIKLNDLNNFKKIALLETINMYLMLNQNYRVFQIRNSKMWVKSDEIKATENNIYRRNKKIEVSFPLRFKKYNTSKQSVLVKDVDKLNKIYTIIYNSLISSLQSKYLHANKKAFRLPEKCTLTAPRSEKAFVGEYPFGSSLSLVNNDLVIGISWDVEDNAADIDLSLLNKYNQKIGWNSSFRDSKSNIYFSGDVVQAPGTELIYASSGFDFDAGVYLNLYRSLGKDQPSTFKFFIAREKIEKDKMVRNYMIDPNNISFSTKLTFDSKEMLIGFITEDRFIFSTFRSSDSRVSCNTDCSRKFIEFNLSVQKCHLDLRKILTDSGLYESSDPTEDAFTFDSKADIIGFFKNQ